MNSEPEKEMLKNSKDIAVLLERQTATNQRLDAVEKVAEVTYRIAANLEALTIEVKHLSEGIKDGSTNTEEQIAALKADNDVRFKSQGERFGALENKPGKKWEDIEGKILLLIVGAVVTFLLTRLGL